MKDDLRYTPSDCFETFPMPCKGRAVTALKEIATKYQTLRSHIASSRNMGLTKVYDRFHDPACSWRDILKLRELQAKLDQEVLHAYGWLDLAEMTEPEFLSAETELEYRYQNRLFWPAPFRNEVLARLLALNVERAADERARGLAPAPAAEELEDV